MNTITIEMTDPRTLDDTTLGRLCEIVAAGFGRDNDKAMQADSISHLQAAAELQIARAEDTGIPVALAMYARSLWRPGR